ncbi:TPA: hypothetical protein ACXJF2_003061 [Serratia marcescens]
MSYARQTVTDKQPSLTVEAANEKRAALMRRVHAARLAGELQPISPDSVENATESELAAKLFAELANARKTAPLLLYPAVRMSHGRIFKDGSSATVPGRQDVFKFTLKYNSAIPRETSLESMVAVEIHNALDENDANRWKFYHSSDLGGGYYIKLQPLSELHLEASAKLVFSDSNAPLVHRYDATGLANIYRRSQKRLPKFRKNKVL